ncbi:hypothetical protein E4U41_006931, partial [Claviceps citrina]
MPTTAPRPPHGGASSRPSSPSSPSSAVVQGASLLILLQVASRLVTFVANQLLLRYLTAPLLGLSTQLEVYYLSVLFFSRESLRVAIQRQGNSGGGSSARQRSAADDDDTHADAADAAKQKRQDLPQQQLAASRNGQAIVNLGYLAIVLGLFASTGLGWLYLAHVGPGDEDGDAVGSASGRMTTETTPHLTTALYLYGLAALTELLSEPCFVLMQTRLRFGTRAAAESLATLLRCVVVVASAVWSSSRGLDLGLLPFALGQCAYGTGLLAV